MGFVPIKNMNYLFVAFSVYVFIGSVVAFYLDEIGYTDSGINEIAGDKTPRQKEVVKMILQLTHLFTYPIDLIWLATKK